MIHSTLGKPPVPTTSVVSSLAAADTLAFRSALHDMNNLLLIMSTYTSLAVDKLPVDSSAYGHMSQAKKLVSQAAMFAHELRIALE